MTQRKRSFARPLPVAELTVVLRDHAYSDENYDTTPVKVRIRVSEHAIELLPNGYGTYGMANGHGTPAYLEFYNGELVLRVWSDINQEDPTHRISLEGAREVNRK